MTPLPREFYARGALTVARALPGKTLRHGACAGIIVETEAYIAPPATGPVMPAEADCPWRFYVKDELCSSKIVKEN